MVILADAFWNAPDCFWAALNCFKQQKTLAEGFQKPLGPDAVQTIEVMMRVSPEREVPLTITWDLTMQHTITWNAPIELPVQVNGKPALLDPGFCNLYRYPKVYFSSVRQCQRLSPLDEGGREHHRPTHIPTQPTNQPTNSPGLLQ